MRGRIGGLSALAVTWTFIGLFFVYGPEKFEPLASENLFIRAYEDVSKDSAGWIWSSLLLTLVVPLTASINAYAHLEEVNSDAKKTRKLDVLALVLVGFLGAISAMMMFLLDHDAFKLRGKKLQMKRGVDGVTLLCSALAFASTALLPLTVFSQWLVFTSALFLLHGVLIVPLLVNSTGGQTNWSTFFKACAAVSCLIHLANLAWAITHSSASLGDIFSAPINNHCQTSISIDAVVAAVASLIWYARQYQYSTVETISLGLGSLFVSPGAVFSYGMARLNNSKQD